MINFFGWVLQVLHWNLEMLAQLLQVLIYVRTERKYLAFEKDIKWRELPLKAIFDGLFWVSA